MNTASVPNTFASSTGTVSLSLLDTNFTSYATFLNSTFLPEITATTIPSYTASTAQMQTATASTVFVSSAGQKNHPAATKAYASFIGTATGTVSFTGYGVTRIVRAGTGTYSVVLSTGFASTEYAIVGLSSQANSLLSAPNIGRQTTDYFEIKVITLFTATALDPNYVHFSVFGI